jgi:tetratricopeptide (TPR) repeat protein
MSVKTYRDLNPTARSQVDRAKTAIQSKNYDYGITLLLSVLKDEPIYLDGRRLLRAAEIQKYNTTGTLTRQMTSMRTGTLAMKLSTKKAPQDQLAAAEEILQTDPYNHKANAAIGEAGAALGCPELKCFAYETLANAKVDAKAGDKSAVPILRTLAEAYMESGQADKAVSTLEKVLTIDPRDGDSLSLLKNAQAAVSHQKWEEAQKTDDFRKALKDEKESEQLETQGKIVKSSESIEEQIQINYQKWQENQNSPAQASAFAKKIGQLYEQRNEYANAIPWYQAAFEGGGSLDSSLERVIGDMRLRANDAELRQLKDDAAQQTDPAAQEQYKAAIEQKEVELNKVQLDLAEARVKAQPTDGELRFFLGEALYKDGQYKRATEELQQAINTQPSVRYPALNLLGLAFMKRGMVDFAISKFAEAEHDLPDMKEDIKKEVTYNLGLAYEASKQPEKALEQWKKIYTVAMNYRDVAARVEASYGGGS